MFRPQRLTLPEPEPLLSKRLGDEIPFSGINLKDADTAIGEGQSPYMKNVTLDDGGKPTKRRGQTWLMEVDIPDAPIRGYYNELFAGKHVFAGSSKLYSYDETTGVITELMAGLSDKEGFFYVFNDVLYYKNRAEFISISNTFTVKNVITDGLGYIPTTVINKKPNGEGGTAFEERNLIQPGFTETFKGETDVTAYYLTLDDLDDTPVKAKVIIGNAWVDYVENTDFTVDRTIGKVTFNTAPAARDDIANVSITAYKTENYADRIIKAVRVALYGGGTNDSRIFCCGNPDYKNVYWFSGLTGNTNNDALYYPENGFNRIGSDAKYISGWSYLYSTLLALKEDGIYKITYSSVGGYTTFPAAILNRQVGCDMPGSIQIIKNYPVFGNTQSGLWTIVNVIASDTEKNVEPLSALINKRPVPVFDIKGLLEDETEDLIAATSFDDGKKYYLCVGDHCWIWDYDRRPYNATTGQNGLNWYYWTNVSASKWHFSSREIYYAHRATGNIVKFQDNLNDFGNSIDGVYRIKQSNFDRPERLKDIPDVWVTTRASAGATLEITYFNDNGEQTETITVPASTIASFDWDNWDWDNFTWDVQQYAPTFKLRPKIKKVNQCGMEFRNNKVNENLSLLNLVIYYKLSTFVK